MVLKISKKDLENTAFGLLIAAIFGGFGIAGYYFIFRDWEGRVVYRGNVSGRNVELRETSFDSKLTIYGKDKKPKFVFFDYYNDGKIEKVIKFNKDEKRVIEKRGVIGLGRIDGLYQDIIEEIKSKQYKELQDVLK